MAKKTALVDYNKCDPERCNRGVCIAASHCEHGSLLQESPQEVPEINPTKWCHGCAKCATACPLNAIVML